MSNAAESAEREACAWEARVRRATLKRLENPLKLAKQAVEKEQAERITREQELLGYESDDDAHDAFGYDLITYAEYEAICSRLRGAALPQEKSEKQAVYDILFEFASSLKTEARDLEWASLADEEKEKIRREQAEYEAGRKAKKEAKQAGEV